MIPIFKQFQQKLTEQELQATSKQASKQAN